MELIVRLVIWIKKHPIKLMFFITIPVCIITSLITTLLLM